VTCLVNSVNERDLNLLNSCTNFDLRVFPFVTGFCHGRQRKGVRPCAVELLAAAYRAVWHAGLGGRRVHIRLRHRHPGRVVEWHVLARAVHPRPWSVCRSPEHRGAVGVGRLDGRLPRVADQSPHSRPALERHQMGGRSEPQSVAAPRRAARRHGAVQNLCLGGGGIEGTRP